MFLEKDLHDKKLSKNPRIRFERLVVSRPCGNPTLLIFDQDYMGKGVKLSKEFVGKSLKEFGNDRYAEEIEQGGVLTSSKYKECIGKLEMFGGEFCGNATRSAVWYLTQGVVGKGFIEVSGTNKLLEYEVKKNGSVKVEMPFKSILKLSESEFLVELEGISHLVILDEGNLFKKDDKTFQSFASQKLKENHFKKLPACGVSVYNMKSNESRFAVWVSAQETMYNETSCGSGTSAIGAVLCFLNNQSQSIDVIQPSGQRMKTGAIYHKKNHSLQDVFIEGKVETLYDGSY